MKHHIIAALRRHWHELVQLHDTPHSIAGGVAIGIFMGFTPLFSIKTLLAILIAWIFRCSKVSAAVAVNLHDVTLPLAPVIFRLEYGIGYWILSSPHHWPPRIHIGQFHVDEWLHWGKFVSVIWPMLIGSIIFGIPLAVAGFFITLPIVEKYQKHRAAKAAQQATAQ